MANFKTPIFLLAMIWNTPGPWMRISLPGLFYFIVFLFILTPSPRAQQPAVPPGQVPVQAPGAAPTGLEAAQPIGPPVGVGEFKLRAQLVMLDQMAYETHPFFQITGDNGYASGKGTASYISSIGFRETDKNSSFFKKLLHALPPFGVEGVTALAIPFPRGLGIGLDYNMFSQQDTDAASGVSSVIAIKTESFIYSGVLRLYVFNPNEPGINYFVGFGLGFLEGTLRVPFSSGAVQYIPFRQSPVGSTRMGLESRGESWGFRYELAILNADSVELESNPYPNARNSPSTTIDFSGSVIRISLFIQFD